MLGGSTLLSAIKDCLGACRACLTNGHLSGKFVVNQCLYCDVTSYWPHTNHGSKATWLQESTKIVFGSEFQHCSRGRFPIFRMRSEAQGQYLMICRSNYLLQCCLQNRHGENQEPHPSFLLDQLRSLEYAWNNVGKLEIVLKRVWLIAAVPPNWIIVCGLFPEIHEVLELHFHFITMMSLSHLVLKPVFPVENA